MQRTITLIAATVLALAAGSPAAAQAGNDGEEVRLSLDDCLRIALENNLDLVAARIDPEISAQNVEVQAAGFDPVWQTGTSYEKRLDEPFNPSSPNEQESVAWNASWSEQLTFGGKYVVALDASRFDASAVLFDIDSAYGSSLSVRFDLPLLRGLGKEPTTELLLLARGDLDISREELRRQAHLVLETVEGAYWDVIAAREALRVARESLDRAQDLLDLNRKKVEVGTLAPIEITQAEAGVASQEESVIVAETLLENAEDELRRLLAVPPADPMWGQPIVPTDRPDFVRRPIDLDAAIDQAFASRPELASARQDLKNRELSERVAANAAKPELTLQTSLAPSGNNFVPSEAGPDGIFGTPDDIDSDVSGGLITAFEETPKFANFDVSVSLTYKIPIGNRAAKANYKVATLNREKAGISLRSLEQDIRVEVRRAVRAVESGFKRVEAARASVVLQKKKLEAEQKKFDNGMSTSFQVLEFQNDLSEAELSLIRAGLEYVKALTGVERAKGTLLEARGLRLK